MDREDDMRVGVKSTAILFGSYTWIVLTVLFLLFLIMLVILGLMMRLGALFFSSLIIAAIPLIRQVIAIREGIGREKAFSLFKAHAWIGAIILTGIILDTRLGYRG